MDATAPRRFSLRARFLVAGLAAAAIPAAIPLVLHANAGPGLLTVAFAAMGAWLLAGAALALFAHRLTGPLERLAADTAAQAEATRAGLEQQMAARTVELSEARDRAEREARLKGVFLAAMSHEIRTPMNSIVGMAELMAETRLDSEQREYCDTIRTSTDALLGVINDILDFSKFEAQGVQLETLDFDLGLVVEDAVELLAVKAAATGIDLAAVVEPGFDGRFRGDPSRLRQVLVNLIGNAAKFTAKGSVVVRVATLGPGLDPGATGARIEVIDTGIGMTPEGVARLFRPFAQAEDSTSRHYGGTGLGLTITKQIVERMDGRIGVTSAPGRGSTFWVEIPFPRATALPAPARFTRRVSDALIFEPRDASADALAGLLSELGVVATRAASMAEARAALETRTAGFALAFVSLDAADAAPVIEALQQHPSAGRTALVAIVPAGKRGGAELERLGSSLRLTRPIRRARLVECLDAAPVRPPVAVPVPAAVEAPADALRVLVADDYYANQRLVTRLLEKRGYAVEVVADGQAAVDATLDRAFDLVLMDCQMPLLDGYEATARIRSLERGRRTPILAMTANDSLESRDACLRAGMDDYLTKPIKAAVVLAAVDRWSAIGRGGSR